MILIAGCSWWSCIFFPSVSAHKTQKVLKFKWKLNQQKHLGYGLFNTKQSNSMWHSLWNLLSFRSSRFYQVCTNRWITCLWYLFFTCGYYIVKPKKPYIIPGCTDSIWARWGRKPSRVRLEWQPRRLVPELVLLLMLRVQCRVLF